jgi:hypothetical protein
MLLNQTLHTFGYGLSPNGYHMGVLPVLSRFFQNAGLQKLQKKAYFIDFSAGTPLHETFYHNYASGYASVTPLIERAGLVNATQWQELHQRLLAEMLEADFCAAWLILSVWGYKL